MIQQYIHVFASSIYITLIFLFLIISTVPRIKKGAKWWAEALFFAFLARIAILSKILP